MNRQLIILPLQAIIPPWAFHLHDSLQTSIREGMQNIIPPLQDYLKVQVKSQAIRTVRAKVTFQPDQQSDHEDAYDGDIDMATKKIRPKKSGSENAFHVCLIFV